MTGPKLNEGSLVVGERSGTKATARYLRTSAYKAREVLDLIRGLDVRRADQVLQFTDREVSNAIRKVLASAVANAQHNDEQDPDELFVKACFADEGPTLRRFRPRARGRATRVRKRTCHITIIVARLSDEKLAVLQARETKATGGRRRPGARTTAASRRERVERSRQRAQGLKPGDAALAEDSAQDEALEDDATLETTEAGEATLESAEADEATTSADESSAAEATNDDVEPAEGSASDEAAPTERSEGGN